ncbi:MAG: autotransporter outer membrane beta-barrel domain-containing protein [Verrucomicrobiales bacterium]|nr:autotransporter outer membrane beta-barrel domain-containing protein [Verrucomicrobiales bacterium]
MKTPNMKTRKLTLIFLCVLSVSALNVLAENKLVDSGTVVEADKSYNAPKGDTAALVVRNAGATYDGTNITLSSTFSGPGYGLYAARAIGSATLYLSGGTLSSTAGRGLNVQDLSVATLNDVTINGRGGIWMTGTATLSMEGGSIATDGASDGVYFAYSSTVTLKGVNIRSNGNGVYGRYDSTVIAEDTDIVTTGSNATGVFLTPSSTGTLTNVTIRTEGDNSMGVHARSNTSTITLTGGTITTTGNNSPGVYTTANGAVVLTDAAVGTTGDNSPGVFANSGRVSGSNVTLTTTGSGASAIHADNSAVDSWGASTVIFQDSTLSAAQGDLVTTSTAAIVATVVLDHVQATNGGNLATAQGEAELILTIINSAVNGDIVSADSSHAIVNLDDSTQTGDTHGYADSTVTITGSNGATITGTVSGNDNSVIDLDLTGPGSSFTGDIIQNDDAAVALTLNDSASGQGGYTGGTLNVSADSVWNFTKNSITDSIDNHGTIHLGTTGNYIALHSDSISGDGAWYFPVDSDTGAKSTVSGSTAATSHPRGTISATGDGLRDPNTVANTLVTGENKENWIWDNFSWGLEEYTQAGHDADGNPHFTQHSTSPAGAVLNSAIAIQQSMWFAQQDNLLKRLGELHFSSSRQPVTSSSDKAVTLSANNLIENIWLRSYGQQLNISSQVSGKAYEQLIYGVDLGTDHKFTLSADSDLYLGVYAGYGRSDIDYRTPNTDGELNSYYGGLYATWLHSSGFYIDATFKAASIDNNLKAPYGNNQLTADYNNVNIGGSIEIGKKFTFTDDWFIEPQFQVNYLHILAEDYQAGPMSISAQDLDALQLRIGSLFGRSIKLTNGGALQPYVKISGVETISSGGTLHNGYQHIRANTDGARAELGGGLIWQLDADNQLHLDYEASFGDKYDKPWGLTAGYRHQF